MHKEVEGHNHQNVDDDNGIAYNSDNIPDQDLEDMKTLINGVICKNQNLLLDCSKNLRVVLKNTQSMDDMLHQNDEDQSLNGCNERQVISSVFAEMNKSSSWNATSDCVIIRDYEDLMVNITKRFIHQERIKLEQLKDYSTNSQERSCT